MSSPTGRRPPDHPIPFHQLPVYSGGKSIVGALMRQRADYLAEQRRIAQFGIQTAVKAFIDSFRK